MCPLQKGGLLQEEEKKMHIPESSGGSSYYGENGGMEEESSCLYFSTCDIQGLGKEPRNEEHQKQTTKLLKINGGRKERL